MLVSASLIAVLRILNWLILARVILSWLPMLQDNPVVNFVFQVTEPILAPVRNIMSRYTSGSLYMFDFSPIIVWLLIDYLLIPLIGNFIRF